MLAAIKKGKIGSQAGGGSEFDLETYTYQVVDYDALSETIKNPPSGDKRIDTPIVDVGITIPKPKPIIKKQNLKSGVDYMNFVVSLLIRMVGLEGLASEVLAQLALNNPKFAAILKGAKKLKDVHQKFSKILNYINPEYLLSELLKLPKKEIAKYLKFKKDDYRRILKDFKIQENSLKGDLTSLKASFEESYNDYMNGGTETGWLEQTYGQLNSQTYKRLPNTNQISQLIREQQELVKKAQRGYYRTTAANRAYRGFDSYPVGNKPFSEIDNPVYLQQRKIIQQNQYSELTRPIRDTQAKLSQVRENIQNTKGQLINARNNLKNFKSINRIIRKTKQIINGPVSTFTNDMINKPIRKKVKESIKDLEGE
ncbi:hypothetical protein KPH14_012960 [Odynerus spinipes]|uniref:Uncharacterized protein n=1 Tax=Odynerus spinipes TaxID=1348599 RepID=A0AAD9VIA6_9HYME|nr:hypothetical protein KPH14_012960 [Odynerus spinipes]